MRYLPLLIIIFCYACSSSTNANLSESDNIAASIVATDSSDINPVIEVNDEPGQVENEPNSTQEYDGIDWEEYTAEMTQDFSFVIIMSTKNYDAALERAYEAADKLEYPVDLRGLHPNEKTGLSLPKKVCENICGGGMVEYPQYLPRNDWGESKYVSVEYSDGFNGFTPGYFIVIVASGTKGSPVVNEALMEAQLHYEDAYAKTCGVWMGCGC